MYLHIAPTPKVIVLYYDHLISLALWDTLQQLYKPMQNWMIIKYVLWGQSFMKFEFFYNRFLTEINFTLIVVLFMKTMQVGSILFLGAYKFHPSYLLTCDFIN